jgi:ribA/ribD-fused uncharacterized protein
LTKKTGRRAGGGLPLIWEATQSCARNPRRVRKIALLFRAVGCYKTHRRKSVGKFTIRECVMKNFCFRLLSLLFFLGVSAPIWAQAPAKPSTSAAPAKKLNWDDTFPGVVHDAKKIGGFVGGYRWLSNFFPCRVEWDGLIYGSAEAAFHAAKYPAAERAVFTKLTPDQARELSHKKPYDKAAWEARKVRTMHEIVWAKFSQNPELGKKLLATGDRHLEETNWWGDRVWGVYRGEGENLTGKALMDIRARLAKELAAMPAKAQ